MRKRILCLALGLMLTFSQVTAVGASSRKDQLKQQKAETQSQLADQKAKINKLEEQKNVLAREIQTMDADLVNLLIEIDALKGELTAKEEEIEKTKAELVAAEEDRDEQYAAMKKRIQYLYEKGGDVAWAQLLMQAQDLTSFLNQAEYVQQMYDSDRTSLENFKAVVQQVTDLKDQLESEKADLEIMQREYEPQQANLETQLAEKKATSADYTNQIAAAESKASEYMELIRKQNAEIQKIEEEEKRAAEEAARKAAEEAARKAAAEKAQQEEAKKAAANSNNNKTASNNDSNSTNKTNTNKNNTSNNKTNNSSNDTNKTSNSNTDKKNNNSSDKGDSGSSGSVAYNPTGASVVAYAQQFVGNPYEWGGTSLTNGADCSGFVMSVYAKFGVSLPHSSGALAGVGKGVSYADAMPGDIICYPGHVAIYMGGGAIVHASNERDGIKISGNAAYKTIVAVRRVL